MNTNLSNPTPVLTGAKQTMASWAKVLESYAEVPEIYKDALQSSLGDPQTFPHVVLAPPPVGARHKTTEKLVYEANDTLYILAHTGAEVVEQAFPVKKICDIEVGSILLYSWLTIRGMTKAGLFSSATIEFNTSSNRHFADFIAKLRPQPSAVGAALQEERAAFDYLAAENFKFMNYGRSSLVAGEKVIATLWQPEIRERMFPRLPLPFYRTISTAHLSILTDKELILIREDERSSRRKKGARYGGIWQYIPLRSIVSVSSEQLTEDLLGLSVGLSSTGHVDRVFVLASQPEVVQFQKAMEAEIG